MSSPIPAHRLLGLVAESLRVAAASRLTSLGLAALAAAVVVATLLTAGQTAALEDSVMASLDQAPARVIRVVDQNGQSGIKASSLAAITDLPGVVDAIGLRRDTDLQAGEGRFDRYGPRLALATLVGHPDGLAVIGGDPGPDGVLLGARAQELLGWPYPSGGLIDETGQTYEVVGGLTAAEPFSFLADGAVRLVEPSPDLDVSQIHVVVDSVDDVPLVVGWLKDAIVADRPGYTIASAAELEEAKALAASSLLQASRRLILGLLALLLVVQSLAMAISVRAGRQAFGRRRALGASQGDIAAMVVVHSLAATALGAITAGILGRLALGAAMHLHPPVPFVAGVVGLVIVASVLASLPPAILAARSDPARVLRVP